MAAHTSHNFNKDIKMGGLSNL
jgi:hypothetical protein